MREVSCCDQLRSSQQVEHILGFNVADCAGLRTRNTGIRRHRPAHPVFHEVYRPLQHILPVMYKVFGLVSKRKRVQGFGRKPGEVLYEGRRPRTWRRGPGLVTGRIRQFQRWSPGLPDGGAPASRLRGLQRPLRVVLLSDPSESRSTEAMVVVGHEVSSIAAQAAVSTAYGVAQPRDRRKREGRANAKQGVRYCPKLTL